MITISAFVQTHHPCNSGWHNSSHKWLLLLLAPATPATIATTKNEAPAQTCKIVQPAPRLNATLCRQETRLTAILQNTGSRTVDENCCHTLQATLSWQPNRPAIAADQPAGADRACPTQQPTTDIGCNHHQKTRSLPHCIRISCSPSGSARFEPESTGGSRTTPRSQQPEGVHNVPQV